MAITDPNAKKGPVVAKVVLTRIGPKAISEARIQTNISIHTGETFDQAAVDRDVQSLYGTGWFYRLRVIQTTNDTGVALNYCLQEKPTLTRIRFEGNTRYNETYLVKALSLQVGDRWDEKVLLADADGLQEFYRLEGFANAKVALISAINEDAGEAEAVFKITE